MTVLLREAIGDSLRRTRVSQSRTLREVSSSARVSLGYLSEVERGRKEASSELLAAICSALEVPLSEVLYDVSESLSDGGTDRAARVHQRAEAGAPRVGVSPTVLDGQARIAEDTRMVIPAPKARALAAA
ncbi:helix-turn-helix domain-containing protein [Rhodococcus tukisamuensis]|uniref:Helix-turn-helix domain-containing protein n=1 Tax=Rhodococcus tukisamuensis TaxID=168276 RepID=A0A1G6R5W5_9NOCA|nr:helix-turn-helix transcriptional regulator [Rhodococcus tukisamuensis]SDC99783.1 Helix-turn-helix domain-containing protein [Rhodococcus tukisamuensis]